MSVQDTSLQAYFGEVILTLGDRQKQVLAAFTKKEDFTNAELAEFLNWPINTVTPRTNELVKKQMVVEGDRRKCKVTGRMVIAWQLKEESRKSCCVSMSYYSTHGSECINRVKKQEVEQPQNVLF